MLLGVWADQAGVFLAWLCAITTVVFAVPITFFPLRWARLMRWRIPAETQLTVYFGRLSWSSFFEHPDRESAAQACTDAGLSWHCLSNSAGLILPSAEFRRFWL